MRYSKLTALYEKLEATTKRLEKTYLISEFLKQANKEDLEIVMLLLQGRVFPEYDENKIGVASKLVSKAIVLASGRSSATIEQTWKKTGDLGDTAEQLIGKKKQATLATTQLTIKKVFDNIKKLATLTGQGTVDKKVKLISELLTSAEPKEARYIVRTVLEDLRVGAASGTLRDSIVWAYFSEEAGVSYDQESGKVDVPDREKFKEVMEKVQHAHDLTNDYGKVAEIGKEKGLKGYEGVTIVVGKPIKVMLYKKATDIANAFDNVGKPAALEFKYDGMRMQIHKHAGEITLFTRRLEEVTKQFPEVVEYSKKNIKGDDFILDAEAVGYDLKTKKYLAFQNISQRIKRKYDIDKLAKSMPVELNIFDIMAHNGENVMKLPFKDRRKLIDNMVEQEKWKIVVAKQLITDDINKAQKFYEESLAHGEEGIMAKNLEGIYKPGSRVGYGMKIKPVMETLDLVIVGAEWGEGKRKGWLSSFILACVDEGTGEFLEIGKVGTGIKELESDGVTFDQMTKLLKPYITSEKGKLVTVKPKIVIEINYEEIQKSPTYSSGFALRFPRVVRLREDRRPSQASDLDLVEDLYYSQKK